MNTLEVQMNAFLDRHFLKSLEAHSMMTIDEIILSDRRSVKYRMQWEDFKRQQSDKYGLDGGPSPAVVLRDQFIPSP